VTVTVYAVRDGDDPHVCRLSTAPGSSVCLACALEEIRPLTGQGTARQLGRRSATAPRADQIANALYAEAKDACMARVEKGR
jgi:hypothetical protein